MTGSMVTNPQPAWGYGTDNVVGINTGHIDTDSYHIVAVTRENATGSGYTHRGIDMVEPADS